MQGGSQDGAAGVSASLSRFYAAGAKVVHDYYLLIAAYAMCLAAIVLTNHNSNSRTLYFVLVLPVAAFAVLGFARRTIAASVLFWAVAAYLLALAFGSLFEPGIPSREFSLHVRLIPLILSFLLVIGFLATNPRTLTRLLLASCVVFAISASYNVIVYLQSHTDSLLSSRLLAVLGMPDYRNATNISAPYAIYGAAAVAALTGAGLSRLERALFALSGAILIGALILTQSRSGYLAALAGFTIAAASAPRRNRAALLSVIAVAVAAAALPLILNGAVLARGVSYRPELWASYFSMALERPFTGVGILANIDRIMSDGLTIDQPHNLLLSAFVRGGVAGVIAMATMLAGALYWTSRHWLKTGSAIPLTLIVTMTVAGMFDYQLLATYPAWPWVTFWFPIGVAMGVELVDRGQWQPGAAATGNG